VDHWAGVAAPPPGDFVARIRSELLTTLARVEPATSLPWADPTKALLSEMRFRSIADWLLDQEATALCARFDAEPERLHADP
jgi:hypothetical protein